MAKVGFDLINKDVHQANDYTGHGGPQHVAKEKALVQSTFDIDGVDDPLHHLPAVIDPGPHHVFALEFPFFRPSPVLSRSHTVSLSSRILSFPRDRRKVRFRAPPRVLSKTCQSAGKRSPSVMSH